MSKKQTIQNLTSCKVPPSALYSYLSLVDLTPVVFWYQRETSRKSMLLFTSLSIILAISYYIFNSMYLLLLAIFGLLTGIAFFFRHTFSKQPCFADIDAYKVMLLDKCQTLHEILLDPYDKIIYPEHVVYVGIKLLEVQTKNNEKKTVRMPSGQICMLHSMEDEKLRELMNAVE